MICVFLVLSSDFPSGWRADRLVDRLAGQPSLCGLQCFKYSFSLRLNSAKEISTCRWWLPPETPWSCQARHVPPVGRDPESSQMETCNVLWRKHTHRHTHLDHMGRGVVFHGGETSDGTRLCLKRLKPYKHESSLLLLHSSPLPSYTWLSCTTCGNSHS